MRSIDPISLKIQILGEILFKNPGFKSLSGKVNFFVPFSFHFHIFRQPTTKRQYRKRDESWTPDKKSRLGRTDSYSRAVSTAQLTQEQQEMFDKFELPKPIDEFKMPPSKGINRKSHIGKQNFFITVGKSHSGQKCLE